MEQIFRSFFDNVDNPDEVDLKSSLCALIEKHLLDWDVPPCHKLKRNLINRFVLFRLRIRKKKITKIKSYSSKTMR